MQVTVKDICRQNRHLLGGIDKAEEIAEAIINNETVQLPKQLINKLTVATRNMRGQL